ncbi:MAG TPA: PAS domain-containing protein [Candidatus Eisenbacteria bacterium]
MTTVPAHEPSPAGTLLCGERNVLELIATGAPLETTLDALCRVIDEQSGHRSAIFLLDGTSERLTLTSGPNLPDGWRRTVASFLVSAVSPCGAAVRCREQIVCPDLARDPQYADFHDAASAANIRAVWSTPFLSTQALPLGTFAVCSDVPGPPPAQDLELVSRATHLASIAVEHKQVDQQLRSSERLLSEAQRVAHLGSWNWDVPNHVCTWSDELYRIFGVQPGEIDPIRDSMKFIHPDDHATIWTGIYRTLETKEPYSFYYRMRRRDGEERILHSRGYLVSDPLGDPVSIFGTTQDVTESRQAKEALRTLANRLMHAQDDERRRVARMLHETTAQDLAGLKMLLARLIRTSDRLSDSERALLAESIQLADRSMTEIRTLAYLLHPPFLDETGLLSALRWYAKGFADRSGIRVDLDLPEFLERLPQDVETTLFRVVQEALINVHRHADSPTACIRLRVSGDRLALEIEDCGRGMAPDLVAQLMGGVGALGVGLGGVRERLKQIRGTLEVESSRHRTIVRASVLVPRTAS